MIQSEKCSNTLNCILIKCTVMDLINVLPGNSFVNTVQHAAIEEAVFSVDPTDASVHWLDSDHLICVYCRAISVPWIYSESCEV
jgi:hypothetical protein